MMLSLLKVKGRFGGTIPTEASGKPSSAQLAACLLGLFVTFSGLYMPENANILTLCLFKNHFNINLSSTKTFFK
jgi:hypothetical protein